MTAELPPHAALLTHRVEDVDRWKAAFDGHEPARRAAGILGHHIYRAEDDAHLITLCVTFSDLDQAKAFTASPELGELMQKAGVVSRPEIQWLKPIRHEVVSDRQLPAFLLRHRVADVDTWAAGYDAAGELRRSAGIIGHAAYRSVDDPALITVSHQAETFDALHSFLADPQLQAAMHEAGVISEPEVTFHTGGWAKTY
jgi:quinol monooxygenase YgiN